MFDFSTFEHVKHCNTSLGTPEAGGDRIEASFVRSDTKCYTALVQEIQPLDTGVGFSQKYARHVSKLHLSKMTLSVTQHYKRYSFLVRGSELGIGR